MTLSGHCRADCPGGEIVMRELTRAKAERDELSARLQAVRDLIAKAAPCHVIPGCMDHREIRASDLLAALDDSPAQRTEPSEPELETRVEYGHPTEHGWIPEPRGIKYATYQRTMHYRLDEPVKIDHWTYADHRHPIEGCTHGRHDLTTEAAVNASLGTPGDEKPPFVHTLSSGVAATGLPDELSPDLAAEVDAQLDAIDEARARAAASAANYVVRGGSPGDETATARLCDERGMTEYRRPGNPYPCTGSMHVGPDEVVRCDNPIHKPQGTPGDEKPRRCDGNCAEGECSLCSSGDWDLMCDECRSYLAQDAEPSADPLTDPRVKVDSYLIYPTGYDEFVNSDKDSWCLSVTNGHAWGWSIRRGMSVGGAAMNRNGEWIYESRGSKANKARRFPLDEALRIALAHVDTHRINGHTAAEASASVAARAAVSR